MVRILCTALVLLSALFSTSVHAYESGKSRFDDAIAVANRGSGDLSLINTRTLVEQRVNLSVEGEQVEPMYVNHWRGGSYADGNRIFVGDRANDRIIALDDKTHEIVGTVPVGKGVFHQWVQPKGHQLWVVGDIDNTVSVINPLTLEEVKRFGIPAELVEQGGKPHDVFVTRWYAYVSVVGVGEGSKVLRYNTWDFALSGSVDAGGDAHVFVEGKRLYVPSQDDGQLRIFHVRNLKQLASQAIPAAHGITSNNKTNQLLITNIAGGGTDAVYSLSMNGKKVFGTGDTAFPTPHNLALDRKAKQLFVTHSGADSSIVSVMQLQRKSGPVAVDTVSVGLNPFGIGLIRNSLASY